MEGPDRAVEESIAAPTVTGWSSTWLGQRRTWPGEGEDCGHCVPGRRRSEAVVGGRHSGHRRTRGA
jgi:hypothetical protein